MLGQDIDVAVRQRLQDYVEGQGEADGMRQKLIKTLKGLADERATYRARQKNIDNLIKQAKQKPSDQATKE